jgi:hypothetical protein
VNTSIPQAAFLISGSEPPITEYSNPFYWGNRIRRPHTHWIKQRRAGGALVRCVHFVTTPHAAKEMRRSSFEEVAERLNAPHSKFGYGRFSR